MLCSFASLCPLPVFNISCLLPATSAAAQTYKVIDLGTCPATIAVALSPAVTIRFDISQFDSTDRSSETLFP
jgi:hypothetical protein